METNNKNTNTIPKLWRDTLFECPSCGDMAEVETNAPEDYFYDGDSLRCSSCDVKGQIMVDEGNAWDCWDW